MLLQDTVGSMARTAEDLILLDSIVRDSSAETTGNGAVAEPVACAAPVNESLTLSGVRLGLPSTFGWVTDGISLEVGCLVAQPLLCMMSKSARSCPQPVRSITMAFWKRCANLRSLLHS